MTINEKLLQIQMELKVPKSVKNSFGGYKYRTVDMILEKVKPLTEKNKCALILQDDLILIGERYYVKATAILLDLESDTNVATSAYAREQLERKKSDDSQLTGAASTYARKYALAGLFLLDDSDMDPDSYAGAPEDDDPEELDRQEEEDAKQQEAEEKPARRRARSSRKKKEETIEDYMNVPEDGPEELPFSDQDAKLTEDKFYFIEKDGNYIMKHAGEYPPEGGKEITKEEFVKGSAEIATGKKRTRRTRKVRE